MIGITISVLGCLIVYPRISTNSLVYLQHLVSSRRPQQGEDVFVLFKVDDHLVSSPCIYVSI